MAKIAIIGTGISGLGAAYLLHPRHDVTVYEKADRVGGHTRTMNVQYGDTDIAVDTGFIVFNEPNYPHFSAMLRYLGVAAHKSDMSFGATIDDGWLEWGAKNIDTIFGQRRNLLRPAFYRVCRDVVRFNTRALDTVEKHPGLSLGALIEKLGLGDWFRRYYLLPMGGAIWSCPLRQMLQFPAETFVRFFDNHGLLAVNGQPQWYTVTGGAKSYLARLTESFSDRIRTQCGATHVTRDEGRVQVTDATGHSESYDHAIFACHGDEALQLLGDASQAEHETLSAFRYQENHAVLHKDVSVMPKRKRCWASWVYRSEEHDGDPSISITYWMNRLQGIAEEHPIFVTLNSRRAIAEEHVFDRHTFMHPIFDAAAIAAQKRVQEMQGAHNTWFCGAHLRHGFHEDGLWSAVVVAERLGATVPWAIAEKPQKQREKRYNPAGGGRVFSPKPAYETAFSTVET